MAYVGTPIHPQNQYRDTGCRLYHSCLGCIFPRCKEERRVRGKDKRTLLRERVLMLQRIGT